MPTAQAPVAEQTIREKNLRYYGWRVALAANLAIMVGFSIYAYSFSVFVKPLSAQFGRNRQAISEGFALSALAAAIFSPLAGRWLDKYGPRRLLIVCLAAFGAAIAALGFLTPEEHQHCPYLLTRYFGLRSFSTLYGLTWTFYAVAGGTGPILLGRVFDRTGSYSSTLTWLGFASVLAATLMLFLPRSKRVEEGEHHPRSADDAILA